jgi:hypothetical protein
VQGDESDDRPVRAGGPDRPGRDRRGVSRPQGRPGGSRRPPRPFR